jgi:toxin ParE1/3/4
MAYIVSPKAQSDLGDVWDYSRKTWGADQAERYIDMLRKAVETVAENPLRGRQSDEVREGYRKIAAGSHVIFYRFLESDIDIVRILHQRMDFSRHF